MSLFEKMGLVPEGYYAKWKRILQCVTWVEQNWKTFFFPVKFMFIWNSLKLFWVMHL